MRPNVRSPRERASLAKLPCDEQWVSAKFIRHARKQFDLRALFQLNLVESKQHWEFVRQSLQDRMLAVHDFRMKPFRHFDAIIVRQNGNRQNLFNRRVVITRAAVDALIAAKSPESVIAKRL